MSSAKKISQQQLRQMMRERKEIQSKQTNKSAEEVTEDKRIESPLARYDGHRRLSCILCEQYITSNSLWSQHISSKSHKNKIEEMKRKKLLLKSTESKIDVKSNQMSAPKQEEEKSLLKRKLTTNDTNEDQISNKLSKTNVDIKTEKTDDISSDLMETEDNSEEQSVRLKSGSVLPNDFFDNPKETVDESKQINDSKETETKSLPKGFFDDPVKDAKARKVVYKDPIDEQWEQFQKVIAEENTVSQNIIEEDIEVLQIDKNLEEIEEQIANWIKVNEMQKRAELLHNHIINNCDSNNIKQEIDSDSDLDENDLNVFSNWRSRTALNSK